MARISYNATTNSQGVASATITGQGLGRLKYISQTGDLWSNEYEIDDYIFYDKATGQASTNWGYNTTELKPVADNEGTTVTNVGSTGRTYWANYPNTSKTTGDEWNAPLCIEVDIISVSNTGQNVALQLVKGSNAVSRNMMQLGTVNGGHIKIVCDGTTAKYYVNENETPIYTQNWNITDFSVRFYLVNGENFKYKNFKIYPIFTAPKHYTPISLSSSSSIIQTGETATLTATLTNVLGEPMANTNVDFIEEDALIAEDKGTSANYTNLLSISSTAELNRLSTYSEIKTKTDASSFGNVFYPLSQNQIVFEFDAQILSKSTGWIFTVRLTGTIRGGITGENIDFIDENWHHYKLVITENLLEYYIDGEYISYKNLSGTFNRLQIDTRDNSTINFKNFKVIADKTVTSTTNSQGVASTTITSDGTGDRTFKAVSGSVESETYSLEDVFAYVTDFTNWDTVTNKGTSFSFSDFTLLTNHNIEVKLNGKGTVHIAIGDKTTVNGSGYLMWIYAWYYDNKRCYTRTSNNTESTTNLTYNIDNTGVLRVEYYGTTLKLYLNNKLINTLTSYDPLTLTRLLRIDTSYLNNVDWIKIKQL